jgi:nucleoside-diphosphate-sugar epimerase
VARALIVGCGCRGRALGRSLSERGWLVRGTTRTGEGVNAIESTGLEPVVADPDAPGSVLEHVADVAVVHWLLGSATGEHATLDGIHGPRLERLLEKLVDTPVRGFVYESAGTVPSELLARGAEIARVAAERWRIPVEVVDAAPDDLDWWRDKMVASSERLIAA